ncbi:MAG: aminodeoxychorismate/anthranilate synthase component II [Lachnospiraceae bacterium]|jgi:anthranilate synthase component 2|nr:aminodeoxychorismate/anthranilate synthase component II [Lachnospiraceae bacterium]
MVLLIDNYDSFSYNLYQYIGVITPAIRVARNDELGVDEIRALAPSHIVISPGPGRPADAGICIAAIKALHADFPLLGICLGHQAIFEAFGGTVSYAAELMHGKASQITVDTSLPLFSGLPATIAAGRYHSLAGLKETLPAILKVTAWTDEGEVMAVAHRERPVYGVQFHPESILTPFGKRIIENFLAL